MGLTGFACRCGGMYCGIHRYSDKHSCTFDYGALGKSEIAAANPVIVAEKACNIGQCWSSWCLCFKDRSVTLVVHAAAAIKSNLQQIHLVLIWKWARHENYF